MNKYLDGGNELIQIDNQESHRGQIYIQDSLARQLKADDFNKAGSS